jgi:hypothetical protein
MNFIKTIIPYMPYSCQNICYKLNPDIKSDYNHGYELKWNSHAPLHNKIWMHLNTVCLIENETN